MARRDPAPQVQDIFQQLHISEASFLFHVTMFTADFVPQVTGKRPLVFQDVTVFLIAHHCQADSHVGSSQGGHRVDSEQLYVPK